MKKSIFGKKIYVYIYYIYNSICIANTDIQIYIFAVSCEPVNGIPFRTGFFLIQVLLYVQEGLSIVGKTDHRNEVSVKSFIFLGQNKKMLRL